MTDALIRVVIQGDEAVAGVGRIDQALGRLERSEPTMALRSTRRAIDELAASASGLHPVFARVLATFAQFSIGGAVGLGVVAGFAAIGLEVKSLISFSGELDKTLDKLNAKFASLGGAGASGFAQLAQIRDEEPSQPGPVGRLIARVGSFFEKPGEIGDQQAAIEEGIGAQEATIANATTLMIHKIHHEHAALINAAGEAVRKVREELSGINAEIQTFIMGSAARGMAPLNLAGIHVPTLAELQWNETARQVNLAGTKQAVDAIGINLLGVGRGQTSDIARQVPRADKEWERIGSAMLTGMTMIASARGGNVGAAALGALGETATAASGLKMFAGEAKWLGPAGFALSAVSSLASLFGGGQKPKVIITAFEEEAARQIKELRSDPATTSYIIIGPADARRLMQQTSRLARMGVIQRQP